eukprot:6479386-Amphidinium_carterae.1
MDSHYCQGQWLIVERHQTLAQWLAQPWGGWSICLRSPPDKQPATVHGYTWKMWNNDGKNHSALPESDTHFEQIPGYTKKT